MKRNNRTFTLIELVTVLAISALIFTLVGVAFSGITRGTEVKNGATEVGNALALAQARAATRQRYVAVIFNQDETSLPSRVNRYPYGAFRLAYVKPVGGGFQFVAWMPGQDWTLLPPSTMVLSLGAPDNDFTIDYNSNADVKSISNIQDDAGNDLSISLKGLVFSPQGTLKPLAGIGVLVAGVERNADGSLADGSNVIFNTGENDAVNIMRVKINKFTGAIKYEEL